MYVEASPETVLSERYVINEPVEEGAATFKAYGYEKESGGSVFMKARSDDDGEQAWLRTLNEANQLDSFDHPQIPKLCDSGQFGRYAFIVMERMSGNPYIGDWLNRYPRHELAARISLSAAGVLAEVHDHRKVHRDVKPGNMRTQWSGRVALVDFELMIDEAPEYDDGISNGYMAGTPTYMAPELLVGERATARSDIHALGVTMCGLTYGRPPFNLYGTAQQQLDQRAVQNINFWQQGRRAPDGLRRIIQTATQPNPDYRYESVGAMAEEIERWLVDGDREPRLSVVVPRTASEPRKEMATEQFAPLPRRLIAA